MKKFITCHIRILAKEVLQAFVDPKDPKAQIIRSIRLLEQIEKDISYSGKEIKLPDPEADKLIQISNTILEKVKDLINKPVGQRLNGFKFIIEEVKSDLTDFIKETTKVPSDKLDLVNEIYDTVKDLPAKVRRYVKELKRPEPAQPVPILATDSDIKVFLDMDGVICDFPKAVKKLGPKAAKGLGDDASEFDQKQMWKAILDARETFWAEMDWMPRGRELWHLIKKYKPMLLSSPPRENPYAKVGKELWVRDNLPGITLIVEKNKYYYAEMDAILIDDMESNINKWQDASGIGILYEGDPNAVAKELSDIKKKI